ncbi:Molybdenum cofactor guanylyltransferase [Rhodobacteraceae bacterium THAF1]|uniref:molybdenum cofactor guanylyltransferase MobA n=1 Tax=Palleronia sp. THAF1 TaxID=2587842 RepID=UPI000F416595|nr:molybdenum cofactor guanylyltransferase MobA [Palleronia sp. THAF1]QFU09825.1 Molybdenum cofactor guanylyltransferase [Palleronia sp. THAF1]VDC17272.1 Molybdenum cofactor guanylyltransferase [Rhodobacteraceae bacterium THAF1]
MIAPLGVILAGGRATRMGGGDKGRLMLGGRSILDHVIDRFAPQVPDMALNANGDPDRFADLRLPVIPDSLADHPGPLAGVLAGLDWAATKGATHIVTVAADTPFFPADLVPQLLLAAEAQGHPIALAATPDPERGIARHPTFGLWPVALRDDLRDALKDGTRKVVAWTDRHGTALAAFPVDRGDPFFNVNTPEDLDTARGMA